MALVVADRVKETTTTQGTGTVTLLGASTGYQSFAVIGNANTTYYTIAHQTLSEWEVGIGTYTSSGTTLSRSTVLASSNSGNLVNFSAGTKDVFVTYPAGRSVMVQSGGTGLMSGTTPFTANGVVYADTTGTATTGSDFVYTGTNVGIGVSSPTYKLHTEGVIGLNTTSAPTWSFSIATIFNLSSTLNFDSGLGFTFNTGTGARTRRVDITSTGSVGIGTSSPSTKLEVVGGFTASSDSSFTSTGALLISKGTTAEQPGSPATGMIRYNTTNEQFEGYSGSSPAWKSIGGSALSNDTSTASNLYPTFAAATTGTAENLYTSNAKLLYKPSTGEFQAEAPVAGNGIFVNKTTVNTSYTIASGTNGWSVGPVTVASGVAVTVSSGQRWLVA